MTVEDAMENHAEPCRAMLRCGGCGDRIDVVKPCDNCGGRPAKIQVSARVVAEIARAFLSARSALGGATPPAQRDAALRQINKALADLNVW
jgi:acyl-CoA reductase-like NAD-dependent aldehyde dehydrogenase